MHMFTEVCPDILGKWVLVVLPDIQYTFFVYVRGIREDGSFEAYTEYATLIIFKPLWKKEIYIVG